LHYFSRKNECNSIWFWLCWVSNGGVCLAEVGNDVVCIDVDQQKIDNLKKKALFPYMNLGWTSWLKTINKQGE